MNRSRNALLALFLALCASCSLLGLSQTGEPLAAFVRASRTTKSVVAPRFQAYVLTDGSLDEAMRSDLLALVDDWELALSEAESYLGGPRPGAGR